MKPEDDNGTKSEQSVANGGHLDIWKGLKEDKEEKERELYNKKQRSFDTFTNI